MGALDLTVQVLDLSPRVTPADLHLFFSYCGTIDSIRLQRHSDQTQLALVTFKQPYAFQTALLLNGATILDRPMRVSSSRDSSVPSNISDEMNNESQNNYEKQGFIPTVQAMASKCVDILRRTKDEVEEKFKLSDKGRAVVEQTRLGMWAAEKTAGHIGTMIVNSDYISNGVLWMSGLPDKASEFASELRTKRNNPNSRKQK